MKRWSLSNVLVAGRRESGDATGYDADDATRRFVARLARARKANVAAAIVGALADRYKKVSPLNDEASASRDADRLLAPARNFLEWPAMSESEISNRPTRKVQA